MYSDLFSKIYNEFGWNAYPEAFAGSLRLWMQEEAFSCRRMLDLGCGTGVLCRLMRAQGIQTTGVDLSEGMIQIAGEQDPDGDYEVGDMTTYLAREPVDLVTCCGDALNHLPTLDAVRKTCANVMACLREGGYFIFDLLSSQELSDEEPILFDYSDTVRAQLRMLRAGGDVVCLEIRTWENGVPQLTETITEHLYSPEEVRYILEETGFSKIRISHRLVNAENHDAVTWYVTAQK